MSVVEELSLDKLDMGVKDTQPINKVGVINITVESTTLPKSNVEEYFKTLGRKIIGNYLNGEGKQTINSDADIPALKIEYKIYTEESSNSVRQAIGKVIGGINSKSQKIQLKMD